MTASWWTMREVCLSEAATNNTLREVESVMDVIDIVTLILSDVLTTLSADDSDMASVE